MSKKKKEHEVFDKINRIKTNIPIKKVNSTVNVKIVPKKMHDKNPNR